MLPRSRRGGSWGSVLVCYALGLGLAHLPGWAPDPDLANTASVVAVALAIPLLLFSLDVVRWVRLAGRAALSFGLCVVSVAAAGSVGALLFRDRVARDADVVGMLAGVYTGGTPNLAAIGVALGVPPETFVTLNAADIVVSTIYLPFLLAVAPRLYARWLPPFAPAAAWVVSLGFLGGLPACTPASPPPFFEVVHLHGSPYQRGFQHGRRLASKIRSLYTGLLVSSLLPYLNRERADIASVMTEYQKPRYDEGRFSYEFLLDSGRELAKSIPEPYLEEMRGIADGAGLPYEDILLLNTFMDSLFNMRSITFFIRELQAPVLTRVEFLGAGEDGVDNDTDGQTDEPGEGVLDPYEPSPWASMVEVPPAGGVRLWLRDQPPLTDPTKPGRPPAEGAVNLSDTLNNGMVGQVIAHLLDLGEARLVASGVPVGVVGREILRRARDVEKAVGVIRDLPASFGWNFLLADAGGGIRGVEVHSNVLEEPDGGVFVLRPGDLDPWGRPWAGRGADDLRLASHAVLRTEDISLDFFGLLQIRPQRYWTSSYYRSLRAFNRLGEEVSSAYGRLDASGIEAIVRTPDLVDHRDSMNAVVFETRTRTLLVAAGQVPATDGPFVPFDLAELARVPPGADR